jgi:hypothetical protein
MTRWMTQDRWTAVVCILISVLVVLAIPSQASHVPLPGTRSGGFLDGAFFPELAVAVFFAAAAWLFIEAKPKSPEEAAAPTDSPDAIAATEDEEPPGISAIALVKSLAMTAGLLVYVQFMEPVGYLPATIVGVTILAFVCGQRSWIGAILGGIVFPVAIYFLFLDVFRVPLPRGDIWSGFL